MAEPKQAKIAAKTEVEAAAEQDIDDIMKEIGEIQKDLAAPAPKPSLKVVPKPPEQAPPAEEEMSLEDFRGKSDEPGMEEMLADLKEDESSQPKADSPLKKALEGDELPDAPDDEDAEMTASDAGTEPSAEADPEPQPEAHSEEEVLSEEEVIQELEAKPVARMTAPVGRQISRISTTPSGHTAAPNSASVAPPRISEDEMPDSSPADGSLTMTLTGNMTLNLNYEFEGRTVAIRFEDGCLCVELADGAEFRVPVGAARAKGGRRAA